MKVRELIAALSECDLDLEVKFEDAGMLLDVESCDEENEAGVGKIVVLR